MEIGFHHGAVCDAYEEQANKQGYTFGKKAEFVQKIGFGLIASYIHGILTESEYDKVLNRFNKYLVRNLIKLETKENKENDKNRII